MQIELEEQNFKESLQTAPIVLLYFTSDFCGSCRSMRSVLGKTSEAAGKELALATVKAIDHPAWMMAFNIQSTPTVLLFANGQYISRLTGAHPRSVVERWIERHRM